MDVNVKRNWGIWVGMVVGEEQRGRVGKCICGWRYRVDGLDIDEIKITDERW